MAILTGPQRSAMQRGIAKYLENLPLLEMLEQLAQVDHRLMDRVNELKERMDTMKLVAETVLAIDRQMA